MLGEALAAFVESTVENEDFHPAGRTNPDTCAWIPDLYPHVLARDMMQQVEQVDGTIVPVVGPAAKFSRTPTRVRTPAPAVGAHTEELLDELGIDKSSRARPREKKII